MSSGLWIFLLEAGLALALLGFIVWWTLPKASKSDERDPGSRQDKRSSPP